MEKSKIYTRGGDKGETSLVDGTRVLKNSPQIELYGEVDELNSWIGLIHAVLIDSELRELKDLAVILQDIQSELFNLGSNLACPVENREKYSLPQVDESIIMKLEQAIDRMDSKLSLLRNFILPGGSVFAAYGHIARTVARRVERKAINLEIQEANVVGSTEIKFLNRLSDFLFVLSRMINKVQGKGEVAWKPKN